MDFPALNTAHIQDIIDQWEQMITGGKNLTQIIPNPFFIINVAYSQCGKTNNRIHWCPDIVRHIGKKGALCLVCSLRSADRLRKGLIHFSIRGTIWQNQDIFLFSVYLAAHCNVMKPAVFSCFLMNIFKIPFLLLMNLDFFQILLLRIFNVPGMQFPKDTNIFTNLFYCNSQQFFHIGTDVICLICFCIQHQENVIYIHWQLLKQFVPVQDLRILSLQVYPVFPENNSNKKTGNTHRYCTYKQHSATLQNIHTCIDDISLDKSQKDPVLRFGFLIDQIVILSIQIYQHCICMSFLKLFWKLKDLFFRQSRMFSQNPKEIIHLSPCLRRMIHNNTAIRMNHITLGISIESRNIQHIYDIRVFIGNGNGIIFKALITSMRPGSSKNKELGFSGNRCIGYNIISLPDLIFNIFLQSQIPGFTC